jgi:hypothetical protein
MYVQKAAGQKTVEGSFVIRSNDSIQAEGQTLVVMYRRKVTYFLYQISVTKILIAGIYTTLEVILVVHS